jgi:excisionase family DNA binding protein
MSERRLLKVKQAAEYLGCSPFKIRRLAHDGELAIIEDCPGSPWRIDIKDLDKWVDSHKQASD